MMSYIQYCCFSRIDPSFSILKRDHDVLGAGSLDGIEQPQLHDPTDDTST
jgi:hypothetical protein